MSVYKKKTWTEPVIEAANRAETEEEKKLRGMINIVMVLRDSPRLKDQERFYTGDFDLTTKEGFREFDQHRRINALMDNFTKHLESVYAESICFIWDLRINKDKPYLKRIPDPKKQIFRDLIQNLQDPDWIAALRWCPEPECLNLVLSNSKWTNKFCSKRCKEKYHGRKNKKDSRKKRKTMELERKILETEPKKCVMVGCRSCYSEYNLGPLKNVLKNPSLDMEYCPKCKAPLVHWIRYPKDLEYMEEAPLPIEEWKKYLGKLDSSESKMQLNP